MLSVVLATYNEAHNLSRCLKSVRDIADEVIVVDGDSPDGTATVARQLGAKVISTTNKPNFHINKQLGLDVAKGDLVLQLDADEELDSELRAQLKALHKSYLSTSPDQLKSWPAAWEVARKNLFLGRFLKKGGQYPDPVIRIFRQGMARLPQKDVHEQMEVDGRVERLPGHLLHYANPTFSDYLRKFNTYTSFKASQLYDQKLPVTIFTSIQFLFWKPLATFLSLYVRHKGFVDGVPGFVFALMSGLHHAIAFLKLWELHVIKS